MPIDGCAHTFAELTARVLPAHMMVLRAAMKNPMPMQVFITAPPIQIMKRLGVNADFPGCYVFIDADTPLYVGISRRIIRRVRQHVRAKTHHSASLAYKVATLNSPHKMRRAEAMKDKKFSTVFEITKLHLGTLSVATVPISCPVEMYAFELYAAMELNTERWNTFKTH